LVVELFSAWLGVEAWSANATTDLPGTLLKQSTWTGAARRDAAPLF
jgi:hypothetical protein